jgi:hypothetical protein
MKLSIAVIVQRAVAFLDGEARHNGHWDIEVLSATATVLRTATCVFEDENIKSKK